MGTSWKGKIAAGVISASLLLLTLGCSDEDNKAPSPNPQIDYPAPIPSFPPPTTTENSPFNYESRQSSFLENILTQKLTSKKTVQSAITQWAQKPGSYMSLGESHLESETARPINHSLAIQFISNTKKKPTFCSEFIPDFSNSNYFNDLSHRSANTKVFAGNTSTETDFQDCKWKSKENALTYSGFFHQYRFANTWPADFPESPVINEPGNNILDQLLPRQGIFISQIELTYLQAIAAKNVLLSGETDPKQFRIRANELLATIEKLKLSMELIYGDTNKPLENKYGTFVGQQAIDADVIMNNSSWILITNRGIHRQESQTSFLRKLVGMDDPSLGKFLKNLKGKKSYLAVGYYGPDSKGERIPFYYAGLLLDGEAEILSLEDRVMVSNYQTPGFQCYTVGLDSPKEPVELNCTHFFR